ncbi:MAG: carbohydrate ABC transporter permease [Bacillota bacterium]|nr:carbohydrate ABC transporter permease [Bacillota bacterium]
MNHVKRLTTGRLKPFDIISGAMLLLFAGFVVYPFYQCLIISLSNGVDIELNGVVYLWPRVFSLESYGLVLKNPAFLIGTRNTVLRTLLGAPLSVMITAMYAYAISHRELVLRKAISTLGLVSMYFGGGLIPTFLLIRDLGLYDRFEVYLLIYTFSMFYALVLLAYFKGLPRSLEECAMIDGANEIVVFFRIILPIAKPAFAAVLLFAAVQQWNSWFDCMIYTENPQLEVLSYIFAKLLLTQNYLKQAISAEGMSAEELMALRGPITSLTIQMATMIIATAPIICIYPFLQKYFVKGIMIGSLKG